VVKRVYTPPDPKTVEQFAREVGRHVTPTGDVVIEGEIATDLARFILFIGESLAKQLNRRQDELLDNYNK
jgi:hypothetical protein